MTELKILLIEDHLEVSAALAQLACDQRHTVARFKGVLSLSDVTAALLIAMDGSYVTVDLTIFDFALSDYGLVTRPTHAPLMGTEVAEALTRAKVPCHAIGSHARDNTKMVTKGARAGTPKPFVLLALYENVVSFADLFADPEGTNQRINEWAQHEITRDKAGFEQRLLTAFRTA